MIKVVFHRTGGIPGPAPAPTPVQGSCNVGDDVYCPEEAIFSTFAHGRRHRPPLAAAAVPARTHYSKGALNKKRTHSCFSRLNSNN